MKKIKVYAGYYELYITDKDMSDQFVLVAEFDTVPEAENYVYDTDDWQWIDRDLLDESLFSFDGDDYEIHTFDYEERIAELA